jgi:hypothetical protein
MQRRHGSGSPEFRAKKRRYRVKKLFAYVLVSAVLGLLSGCVSVPALWDAAGKGDIRSVKALLDKGADVNEGLCGSTPLWGAASEGHTDVVRLLIDRGADVNRSSSFHGVNSSPLGGAARFGHTDTAKLLIEKGASIDMAIAALEQSAGTCDSWAIQQPDVTTFRSAAAQCRSGIRLLERLQSEYFPQVQHIQIVPPAPINVQPVPVPAVEKTPTEQTDATQKLLDAKKLLDANIITKEEFEAIKTKLLPSVLQK